MVIKKIKSSLEKFNLDLKDNIILTEAATGNYAVTPVIAALAGAKVYALAKNSKYGTIDEIKKQVTALAKAVNVQDKIEIIESVDNINLSEIDIITNTGFVRPINKEIINQLSSKCVIPLMFEPWEFRHEDMDINTCEEKSIKVFGTNEDDSRLQTKKYIGYLVLNHLLNAKISPLFDNKILLIGCTDFVDPVKEVLSKNGYDLKIITEYDKEPKLDNINAVVLLENKNPISIFGEKDSVIQKIPENVFVIHICGNVSFKEFKSPHIPENPAPFGYMSYTTDYVDNQAVIDLHTAGLKVAEGMLKANNLKIKGEEYKKFIETDYAGKALDKFRY